MDHYLKKLHILQGILANYRKEMQAVTEKNSKAYREILQERRKLITELKKYPFKMPETALEKMQELHMAALIDKIQEERKSANRFLF